MSFITSTQRRVAVTPFETKEIEKRTVKGFTTVGQKTTLTELKVVYDYEDEKKEARGIGAGTTVWVRGELAKDERFSQRFEIEPGKPFILIPLESILLVRA